MKSTDITLRIPAGYELDFRVPLIKEGKTRKEWRKVDHIQVITKHTDEEFAELKKDLEEFEAALSRSEARNEEIANSLHKWMTACEEERRTVRQLSDELKEAKSRPNIQVQTAYFGVKPDVGVSYD